MATRRDSAYSITYSADLGLDLRVGTRPSFPKLRSVYNNVSSPVIYGSYLVKRPSRISGCRLGPIKLRHSLGWLLPIPLASYTSGIVLTKSRREIVLTVIFSLCVQSRKFHRCPNYSSNQNCDNLFLEPYSQPKCEHITSLCVGLHQPYSK